MIIRARPRYIQESDIAFALDKQTALSIPYNSDILYYTSGHVALRHLLKCLSSYLGRRLHVGMQSFNCITVLRAALDAGAYVTLLDNTLHDFSVSVDSVVKVNPKLDVLVLTHYQGIPNTDYLEIAEYCTKNNIFLIDDVCQTEGSALNGVKVGSLSSAAFGSFGFDKPISLFNGGYIRFNDKCDNEFRKYITDSYSGLNTETYQDARRDLRLLAASLAMTEENIYAESFDRGDLAIFPYAESHWRTYRRISRSNVIRLLMKVYKKIYITRHGDGKDDILKMSPLKYLLIGVQYERLKKRIGQGASIEEKSLMRILDKYEIDYPRGAALCWNRFSFLDPHRIFSRHINHREIQYGGYNWPYPMHMHRLAKSNPNVAYSALPNAQYCSANIVNVPVWSSYFTENLSGYITE